MKNYFTKLLPLKIVLPILFLLIGFCSTTYPIIILPPQQPSPGAQLGEALGSTIGLIAQIAAQKRREEEQARQIRTAYLNAFSAAVQQPNLKKLIGIPQKTANNNSMILLIIAIFSALITLFFFKKRNFINPF